MRIALLSTLARTKDGTPRALMTLGGRPLIAWQMDLARALDCEKLLCLAEGDEVTTDAVVKHAKLAGFEIEFLGGPRHLLGKVTAEQDIVVLTDGLLVDPELARSHFAQRRGVATVSDYPGVEKGFERIDPERAWAGILVARGSVTEQLAQMPADGDTLSLLLRLALQAGTRIVDIDELHLGTGEILLARAPGDVADREKSLLDNSSGHLTWVGPGEKLASRVARRLAPDHFAKGPGIALAAGFALLAGGMFASWFEALLGGLVLIALGSFSVSLSQSLRFLRGKVHGRLINRRFAMIINALMDISIIGALALSGGSVPNLSAVFEPVLLVGLWRLAAPLSPTPARPFWRDRTCLTLILSALAGFGVLEQALAPLIILLLVYALISEASMRLTRA